MIKVASVPAPVRAEIVATWRKKLNYEGQPKVAAWGLEASFDVDFLPDSSWKVNKEMIKLKARILPAPRVLYAQDRHALPRDGGWNIRGMKVSSPCKRM